MITLNRLGKFLLFLAVLTIQLCAQETVDNTNALRTAPFRMSPSVPGVGRLGDYYLNNSTTPPVLYRWTGSAWAEAISAASGTVTGPGSSVQYTLVMFNSTTGEEIAQATGCAWTNTGGGRITCTGGFASGDGTNPAVLELAELTANGSNSVWLAGAASQSTDTCLVWPAAASSSGQILADAGTTASVDPDGAGAAVARTCRVMTWVTRTLSGNTTELATVSGTKTVSKQLAFDASGNVVASASDIGGGGSGADPATLYTFEEDFLYWSATNGAKGEKTWWYSSGPNANSGWYDGEVTDHPGQIRLAILDIGGHQIYWGGPAGRFNFAATQNWIFLVKADETGAADYSYTCGLSSDPETHPAAEEAVIEKALGDSNWFYRTRASAASSTRVDSTAAVSTGWIALKIRKSGSTWYFSTASTISGLTGATELSIATNIPAGASRPFCYSTSAIGGWKGMYWDYVRGQFTVSR